MIRVTKVSVRQQGEAGRISWTPQENVRGATKQAGEQQTPLGALLMGNPSSHAEPAAF